jgi:hypothetical protein
VYNKLIENTNQTFTIKWKTLTKELSEKKKTTRRGNNLQNGQRSSP